MYCNGCPMPCAVPVPSASGPAPTNWASVGLVAVHHRHSVSVLRVFSLAKGTRARAPTEGLGGLLLRGARVHVVLAGHMRVAATSTKTALVLRDSLRCVAVCL